MRFTQFGHHVPRRNSRISAPFSIRPLRVNVPSRLAAPREKSGARDPISRVSVRLCMLSSTVSEAGFRNNNGWGTGMTRYCSRFWVAQRFAAAIQALNSDGFIVLMKNTDFEVQPLKGLLIS